MPDMFLRHKGFPLRLFCYAVRAAPGAPGGKSPRRRRLSGLGHGVSQTPPEQSLPQRRRRAPDPGEQFGVERVRVPALRERPVAARQEGLGLSEGSPNVAFGYKRTSRGLS